MIILIQNVRHGTKVEGMSDIQIIFDIKKIALDIVYYSCQTKNI